MIDIYSKADYPACELSNFATHPFTLGGVEIQSMEEFLQSLKYMNQSKQQAVEDCLEEIHRNQFGIDVSGE